MTTKNELKFEIGNAICYSGYRNGQSPDEGKFPSYEEVKEDLHLLAPNWKYLRVYDSDEHAETVLKVIEREKLAFKVMIGICLSAEVNNLNCPWGGTYSEEILAFNKALNIKQIKKLIKLANQYPDIVFSVAAGNEATVEWTDHLVPVDSIINYVKMIKKDIKQPVTFCENYVPWLGKLVHLVEELDFISMHTYPIWEYKSIEEALDYTKDNYSCVKKKYPNKPIVITEAGWTTKSNGRGFPVQNANEHFQKIYCENLMSWSFESDVLTFVFEAFDETWKGSSDPLEPEKHWGLFTTDRKPKIVMNDMAKDDSIE